MSEYTPTTEDRYVETICALCGGTVGMRGAIGDDGDDDGSAFEVHVRHAHPDLAYEYVS